MSTALQIQEEQRLVGVLDLLGEDETAVGMMDAAFKALSERPVPLLEF